MFVDRVARGVTVITVTPKSAQVATVFQTILITTHHSTSTTTETPALVLPTQTLPATTTTTTAKPSSGGVPAWIAAPISISLLVIIGLIICCCCGFGWGRRRKSRSRSQPTDRKCRCKTRYCHCYRNAPHHRPSSHRRKRHYDDPEDAVSDTGSDREMSTKAAAAPAVSYPPPAYVVDNHKGPIELVVQYHGSAAAQSASRELSADALAEADEYEQGLHSTYVYRDVHINGMHPEPNIQAEVAGQRHEQGRPYREERRRRRDRSGSDHSPRSRKASRTARHAEDHEEYDATASRERRREREKHREHSQNKVHSNSSHNRYTSHSRHHKRTRHHGSSSSSSSSSSHARSKSPTHTSSRSRSRPHTHRHKSRHSHSESCLRSAHRHYEPQPVEHDMEQEHDEADWVQDDVAADDGHDRVRQQHWEPEHEQSWDADHEPAQTRHDNDLRTQWI